MKYMKKLHYSQNLHKDMEHFHYQELHHMKEYYAYS